MIMTCLKYRLHYQKSLENKHMKNCIYILTGLLVLTFNTNATNVEPLAKADSGKVNIYVPENISNAEVVILVSGNEGWNKELDNIAKTIKSQGALVIGVDLKKYLKKQNVPGSKCIYPAGNFESMSMNIQKRYKFKQYQQPILVGYSTGASFVYAVLAQAPSDTFKGAITFGFSPEVTTRNAFCEENDLRFHPIKKTGKYYLEPSTQLKDPFIVLQGTIGQSQKNIDLKKYVESVALGELVLLPDIGNNFSVTQNWLPQFISAYDKITKERVVTEKHINQKEVAQGVSIAPYMSDMPLTIMSATAKEKLPLVFFISGDGGWKTFERIICKNLAESGMPSIGLDALKYFWNEKQPKQVAEAMSGAIIHYMKQWDRNSFILVGYSFGASVIPFIANNFTSTLKDSLKGIYCFSPDKTGDFEVHIADMLSFDQIEKYDVLDELKLISAFKPVCVFGSKEDPNLQRLFSNKGIRIESLPGEHHFNNDYNAISEIILKDFINKK